MRTSTVAPLSLPIYHSCGRRRLNTHTHTDLWRPASFSELGQRNDLAVIIASIKFIEKLLRVAQVPVRGPDIDKSCFCVAPSPLSSPLTQLCDAQQTTRREQKV